MAMLQGPPLLSHGASEPSLILALRLPPTRPQEEQWDPGPSSGLHPLLLHCFLWLPFIFFLPSLSPSLCPPLSCF